jgi:hypothetical protein
MNLPIMKLPTLKKICLALSAASLLLSVLPAQATPNKANSHNVIIFVWDGLRPDSVTAADTPNLLRMRSAGVNFSANHATYPTFTMMVLRARMRTASRLIFSNRYLPKTMASSMTLMLITATSC